MVHPYAMLHPPHSLANPSAPMTIAVLQGLRNLPPHYQGVLLDQFGVLHDGIHPYDGAIDTVTRLAAQGRRILLLSNSSRRAHGALGNLQRMGFDPDAFVGTSPCDMTPHHIATPGVLTSGEVTHRGLSSRQGTPWDGLNTCLHLTWTQRGAVSLDGLGLTVTQDPLAAEFILAHGTEGLGTQGGPATPHTLEQLISVLAQCAARPQPPPMIVANPDLVTVSGSELRVMPGTLARRYGELGGRVHLMGKPAPVIYEAAMQQLGLPARSLVAIGDSLEHDVAGACGCGVDSVFVGGGIHAERVLQGGEVDGAALEALCDEYDVRPTYVMPRFCW